jgi:hypothetical protein
MAKNRASNNNPEKIMRVAFLSGLRFANGASMVSGPLGRGEYEHGRLSTMVYVAMRKEKNELNLCLFFLRDKENKVVCMGILMKAFQWRIDLWVCSAWVEREKERE